jgi:hypothetical protein
VRMRLITRLLSGAKMTSQIRAGGHYEHDRTGFRKADGDHGRLRVAMQIYA